MKIGAVDPEIIVFQRVNDVPFSACRPENFICYLVNSGVTGLTFTKFSRDILGSLLLLTRALVLRYSNSLWNASTKNKGGVRQVYLWCQKLIGYPWIYQL